MQFFCLTFYLDILKLPLCCFYYGLSRRAKRGSECHFKTGLEFPGETTPKQRMENNTRAGVASEGLSRESEVIRAVKLTIYSVIFITGITGNVLVCLVVCRQQKLRTSTNFYIMNLAVADLAVTILCIPFDVAVQENSYIWPFGGFMCHLIYPIMTMCTFASVETLTAIACNRYMAISRPMRMQASRKRAKITIAVIWVISFIFVLPYITVLKKRNSRCEESWSKLYSRIYTVFIFMFQYAIPLSIISLAYIKIAQQLRRNRKHLTAAHRVQDRDVAKVVKMMAIVVLIFAVCMLPNHIVWLLGDFTEDFDSRRKVLVWGEMLIYANSCTNPIVYSICIEEFRLAFKAYITKCWRVTDEDVRPVRKIFERISVRERSVSNDRILARQLNRRLRSSFQRNQSFELSRGSITKIVRSNTSRTLLSTRDLSPQIRERMLPTSSLNVETGQTTPAEPEILNGNAFTITSV